MFGCSIYRNRCNRDVDEAFKNEDYGLANRDSHTAMLREIAQFIGLMDAPSQVVARRAFEDQHPELRCEHARIRVREKSRVVVAVFFSRPGVLQRPLPYKLYAIQNDLSVAEELSSTPDSHYWIRGRK